MHRRPAEGAGARAGAGAGASSLAVQLGGDGEEEGARTRGRVRLGRRTMGKAWSLRVRRNRLITRRRSCLTTLKVSALLLVALAPALGCALCMHATARVHVVRAHALGRVDNVRVVPLTLSHATSSVLTASGMGNMQASERSKSFSHAFALLGSAGQAGPNPPPLGLQPVPLGGPSTRRRMGGSASRIMRTGPLCLTSATCSGPRRSGKRVRAVRGAAPELGSAQVC